MEGIRRVGVRRALQRVVVALAVALGACGCGSAHERASEPAPFVRAGSGGPRVARQPAADAVAADAGDPSASPGSASASAAADAATSSPGRPQSADASITNAVDSSTPDPRTDASEPATVDAGYPDPAQLPACEELYGACPATAEVGCPGELAATAAEAPHCRCDSGVRCLCEASKCRVYVTSGTALMPVGTETEAKWSCYDAAQPLVACPEMQLICDPDQTTCIGPLAYQTEGLGLVRVRMCEGQRRLDCVGGKWAFAP